MEIDYRISSNYRRTGLIVVGGMQPVDISDADVNAMVAYIRSLR